MGKVIAIETHVSACNGINLSVDIVYMGKKQCNLSGKNGIKNTSSTNKPEQYR